MTSNQENSVRLLEHGIKPSVQRLAILDYLDNHRTHPTVDVIYEELAPIIPTLSKTTIYNTLSLFVQSGVALALNIDEKNVHYDGDTSTHAHFRCLKCEQIFDVSMSEFSRPELVQGEVLETHLYYKGICNNCKNQL